ncbi:MAG: CpaF family protein [Acidimicrobiales bacterium]|nr:CpaF family protein [Acidimicrobiales bacterium]
MMKLGDRFKQAGLSADTAEASIQELPIPGAEPQAPAEPFDRQGIVERHDGESAEDPPQRIDPLQTLKRRAQEGLFERLGEQLYDSTISKKQLHSFVVRELDAVIQEEDIPLNPEERHELVNAIKDDILGYGPIERFLEDPSISEVMVNGTTNIFIERAGRLVKTDANFVSEEHLRQVIERIVVNVGRRIDESSAMVDARLPDGSRVNAVIPPLAVDGPTLTIRKFAKDKLDIDDLVERRSISRQSAEFLQACVEGKLNILVSGGTGTGKTTMLNVLSSFIPEGDRIVTIEDAVELQLRQDHVIRLESRPANVEGRGEVTIRDLVRNALRMRPDRIVVGECRGGEALDMLQAMNTGHEGSLTTLHANSTRDALSRLETLVLMAGMDLPVRAIREQVAGAVDMIVQLARMRDGTRRVVAIDEVIGMEGETITLGDLFTFDYEAGFDEEGYYAGCLKPTGIRPMFTERLEQHGIKLAGDLFDTGDSFLRLATQGSDLW